MKKFRVAQVGCGNRGKIHLKGWLQNSDCFDLVAVCDIDTEKAKSVVSDIGVDCTIYSDADRMLSENETDLFCFVTQPDIRLSFVELAAKHRVNGLVFEKPMATSLREAQTITRICRERGIKAAVSHQQKYLTSLRKLKSVLDRGDIGGIVTIEARCKAWLSQLGTHYVDYVLWASGGARANWVAGHVHGKERLNDSHPSPSYTMGQIGLDNGVRALVEFGYLSKAHMPEEKFWLDNRLTVHGTHGYVWADTDGRWGTLNRETEGEVIGGEGQGWGYQEKNLLQPLFARDMADWLDDGAKMHPCNIEISYHGYEIMEALGRSALDNVRVDLPLDPSVEEDLFERMRHELPEVSEQLTEQTE